jgi:hypothetical protein
VVFGAKRHLSKNNVRSRKIFNDERATKETSNMVQIPDLDHYDAELLKGDGVRTVRARPVHVTFSVPMSE